MFMTPSHPGSQVSRRGWLCIPLLAAMMLWGQSKVHAAVDTLYYWRLGEAERAAEGNVAPGAVDSISGIALAATGAPTYTEDVASVARDRTGSGFGVELNGSTQAFRGADSLDTPFVNFGFELWVRPKALPQDYSLIFYTGDTRTDGWGIYQHGASMGVSYGGLGRFGDAAVTVGQWTHLAVVVTGQGSTFYVDGVTNDVYRSLPPNPPSGGVAIGAHPQLPLGEFFNGSIDEVRVFRFDEDQFQPTDFLQVQPGYPIAATDRRTTSATLNALVPARLSPIDVWFEWGPGATRVHRTPAQFSASLDGPDLVSVPLSGLTPSTTYTFTLMLSNSTSVVRTAPMVFRTALPVTSLADGGPGTLRQLVDTAEQGDVLEWGIPGTNVLASPGLVITKELSILTDDPVTHVIDGAGKYRPIEIASSGYLTLQGVTLQGGHAPDGIVTSASFGVIQAIAAEGGGAIWNKGLLSASNCVVQFNHAGDGARGGNPTDFGGAASPGTSGANGGGILNEGSAILDRCLIQFNAAGTGGPGAISGGDALGRSGGHGGDGGGFANSGFLAVARTSLIGNIAGRGGAGYNPVGLGTPASDGAGGYGGAFFNTGTNQIALSTLSGNEAGPSGGPAGPNGGGAALTSFHQTYIAATTIASNGTVVATPIPGVQNLGAPDDLTLRGTILAANGSHGLGPDLTGGATSAGFNLVGSLDPAAGQLTGKQPSDLLPVEVSGHVVPGLLPLQHYGPVCVAHPLSLGSPARDAGDDDLFSSRGLFSTDAALQPRSVGPHVDIGAIENQVDPALLTAATLPPRALDTVNAVFGTRSVEFRGAAYSAGLSGVGVFEFGTTTAYGGSVRELLSGPGTTNTTVVRTMFGLSAGTTYHYRFSLVLDGATVAGEDVSFTAPGSGGGSSGVLGDRDGDGIVGGSEFAEVAGNYWGQRAWLCMTNVAGLGGTNVSFEITNVQASPFLVEGSPDLKSWATLGTALPRFAFADTNAPANPSRFYRLRVP